MFKPLFVELSYYGSIQKSCHIRFISILKPCHSPHSGIFDGHGSCIDDILCYIGNLTAKLDPISWREADFHTEIMQVARRPGPTIEMMIDCHKCEHYYVTWNKAFPHGCRALDFISRQLPNIVVRSSTPDMYCLSFRKKGKKNVTTQVVRFKVQGSAQPLADERASLIKKRKLFR